MKHDIHIHSSFSSDSETPMEIMIQKGIKLGLKTMCFTEHLDMDFPADPDIGDFSLDTPAYQEQLFALKHKYAQDINILFGVELGMQTHLGSRYASYSEQYPFDYIIASLHLLWGKDPYYPSFWEGKDPDYILRSFFKETYNNLNIMSSYDSLGHLDYIVRYSDIGKSIYSYRTYSDEIDAILQHLISQGKALELNTAGLKYGMGHPNPHEDILIRYRELGGELLTIGSDGHKPEHLAYDFPIVPDMLKSLGYRYHFIYKNRKPCAIPL